MRRTRLKLVKYGADIEIVTKKVIQAVVRKFSKSTFKEIHNGQNSLCLVRD